MKEPFGREPGPDSDTSDVSPPQRNLFPTRYPYGGHVPLAVHAKLAARIEQAVHLPLVATLFPKGRLPRDPARRASQNSCTASPVLPQLTRQPVGAEQTRAAQLETAQFQMVFLRC